MQQKPSDSRCGAPVHRQLVPDLAVLGHQGSAVHAKIDQQLIEPRLEVRRRDRGGDPSEASMRGFFESKPFRDQQLGTLERRHGKWVGLVTLPPHSQVELRVAGDRAAPDAASLRLAADASAQFSAVRGELARQLLEHYLPYQDAWQRNDLENRGVELSVPEDVWAHVLVPSIEVDARRVESPIEFRLEVGWDQEHTLGALVRDGTLVELNGSVIR